MSNIDVIKGLYQAFEQGDMPAIFAVLDPEIVWIESDGIPYAGIFKGHDAIRKGVFEKIGSEWENFTATVNEYIDAGDVIVTLGIDSGTYKATRKSMRSPTASIWTLRAGKVVKFVQYIDTLAVASACQ
ncbi:MAG: nuclear transport factor 2 family protein [Cyanothece sp. SIO1E1]|nr:nuclear transport factor 2 family protein [Cyanothece sp. SIO1E1]